MICPWAVDMLLLDLIQEIYEMMIDKKMSLFCFNLVLLELLMAYIFRKLKVSLSYLKTAISLRSCIAIYDSVKSLTDL